MLIKDSDNDDDDDSYETSSTQPTALEIEPDAKLNAAK